MPEDETPRTDAEPWCYASLAGCKLPGLSPYHWCVRTTGHGEEHRCRCGLRWDETGKISVR